MRPGWICTRMMGRETYGEGEKQVMIWTVPHHLSKMMEAMLVWACLAANEPRLLAFVAAVTPEKASVKALHAASESKGFSFKY